MVLKLFGILKPNSNLHDLTVWNYGKASVVVLGLLSRGVMLCPGFIIITCLSHNLYCQPAVLLSSQEHVNLMLQLACLCHIVLLTVLLENPVKCSLCIAMRGEGHRFYVHVMLLQRVMTQNCSMRVIGHQTVQNIGFNSHETQQFQLGVMAF